MAPRTPTGTPGTPMAKSGQPPLLLHLDINKTVIQSDSIQMKSIEEGIREGIAELFWGRIREEGDKSVWEWSGNRPSCSPPALDSSEEDDELFTYASFCKKVVADKEERKACLRSFKLVMDEEVKNEMLKVLDLVMKKLQLPPEVRFSSEAEEVGIRGSTVMMFPAVFHLVAALQRAKRKFALLFRSFGSDHENIKTEWNAFCEMRHPLYSNLIQGIGPLDGSVPGVPDRRIKSMHMLYRDKQGPLLLVNHIVEMKRSKEWDQWAKSKKKEKEDTRGGRDYIMGDLKRSNVEIADGIPAIQMWMKQHLSNEMTSAIKDDWAWWTWNGENAFAGKLLTVLGGTEEARQLFFDDNVDHADPRIVDCRDAYGKTVPPAEAINKLCCKVNSVEAIMDDEYFLRKLQFCHGGNLLTGSSLIDFQRTLTEVEEQRALLQKDVKSLTLQLRSITEENRRMKILHRINVESLAQLRDLLSQHCDLDDFGKDNFRKISDLFTELEQGLCWLELDADGKLTRIFEMLSLKIQYKDFVLIESHEQYPDRRIVSRNHLPGVQKRLQEVSFNEALDSFFEKGLEVNLLTLVHQESPPAFNPEAVTRPSLATESYPIPCKVQQFEATYSIPEKALQSHKDLLVKVGLPSVKNFTTERKEPNGGKITHFWRWDKRATWEGNNITTQNKGAQTISVGEVCDKLFGKHRYREVYENLLLQMFETFVAKKLCGGFSGSMVIRVQPFDSSDGRPEEPCIVKLDREDAIREEHINSVQVFQALPDRAARIIGDPAYATSEKDGKFGAMRLELAGACWNVPELAQGSSNLLSTFKDLLLYESEQMMLGVTSDNSSEQRPFGSVNTVLAETFGPGGIVSSLRKGGKKGVFRSSKQLTTSYTLKGKETEWNPYNLMDISTGQAMARMYKHHFNSDMPDLKELIQEQIKPKLEALAKKALPGLRPLHGLAHGDLNAANIMIDALDAVWLIDFATSVELPLFTDLCKFEMSCLFEYAIIPISVANFYELAGSTEENWEKLGVGDWLAVPQEIAIAFLKELQRLPEDMLDTMEQTQLESIVDQTVSRLPAHKQLQARKAMMSRLVTSQAKTDSAFKYCGNISRAMLSGDCILQTLKAKAPRLEGPDKFTGCASLRFFMDITSSLRLFMYREMQLCFRELPAGELEVCDSLSLQMWMPMLRESYRIIGYRDIPPQKKLWSIYHCTLVAQNVLRALDQIGAAEASLRRLPIYQGFLEEIMKNASKTEHQATTVALDFNMDLFTEADSRWLHAHRELLMPETRHNRIVQQAHAECPVFSEQPGLFAPIFQILDKENKPVALSFHEKDGPSASEALPWRIRLKEQVEEPRVRGAGVPLLDLSDDEWFGEAGPGSTSAGATQVRLQSRLAFLPVALLSGKKDALKELTPSRSQTRFDESFCLTDWMGSLAERIKSASTSFHRRISEHNGGAGRRSFTSPAGGSANGSGHLAKTQEFFKFLTLQAVIIDQNGREVMEVDLCLGMPSLCYPPGSNLCLDTMRYDFNRSESEILVNAANDGGGYSVTTCMDTDAPLDNIVDFDPKWDNHIYINHCNFKGGDHVLLLDKSLQWVNARILKEAEEDSGFRYHVMLEGAPPKQNDLRVPHAMVHVKSMTSDADGTCSTGIEEPGTKAYLHLRNMRCGKGLLFATAFEEELHKMKAYLRARHSSITDALSGTRLDVRTCAVPGLHITAGGSGVTEDGRAGAQALQRRTSFQNVPRWQGPRRSPSMKLSDDVQDFRQGWNMIVFAMDSYNKAKMNCLPGAFWVSGAPGSGKYCFLCRVIMDSVERYDNLVPLRVNVYDLAKRTDQMPELDNVSVQAWFDKYLRILFGEDTPRYKMMKMAISMRRAVFLFEQMDGAAQLMKALEILIKGIAEEGHLTIMTSRPMPAGSTSLEHLSEHIVMMELQPLTDEQKRAIAHSRLGLQGLHSFNNFMKKLRGGRASEDQEAKKAPEDQDDVFGNPMMLSMLLCYLAPQKEQGDGTEKLMRKRSSQNENEGVDLMAVYRVAVTVMLKRMLLSQQADRHINEQSLGNCSRVLERAAVAMQAQQHRVEIDCEAFEKELPADMKQSWRTLCGRAMLLRMHREGNRQYMRFMIKGFQDYFTACAISNGYGISYLPGYKDLVSDYWWAQCLEWLSEAAPHKYVQVMETKIEKYQEEEDGISWLHLAASTGHLPIFKLLKAFSDANQAFMFKATQNLRQMPLHVAAQNGQATVCHLLLEKKAPIDVEDSKERLPLHLALQSGHFQLAKFLLDRLEEAYQAGKTGTDQERGSTSRGSRKESPAEQLACRILGMNGAAPINEEDFKDALTETFVELNYFRKEEKNDYVRQIASLLSVFWISSNKYEAFKRGQKADSLKRESWDHLLQWIDNDVGLTPKRVAAMLVYCALCGIGKISPFRRSFAAEATEHIPALASIVQRHRMLVPSFNRLGEEEQQLVVNALKANCSFNFGQFLQGESLPVTLANCKEIVANEETSNVFGFFLLAVFVSMCGVLGFQSLEGAIFMTQEQYRNFRVGLEAVLTLKYTDALTVYKCFLSTRAELAGLEFDETHKEHHAITRLICLSRVFNPEDGRKVHSEFMNLTQEERTELTRFLNADGLHERGFLLFYSPNFMVNAMQNQNLTVGMALRQLLTMYLRSEAAFPPSHGEVGVITVMVDSMAAHAKTCKDSEVFNKTNLDVIRFQGANTESTVKIVLSPWQIVNDKEVLEKLNDEALQLFSDVQLRSAGENGFSSRLNSVFPEFRYMDEEGEIRKQAFCTMLCIFWVVADRYEDFTRSQAVSTQLTEASWSFLQKWLEPMVDIETLNMVCTAVMVRAVCSIPAFRQQQAPDFHEPRDVMKHVLDNCPKVLPSYTRLREESRKMLRHCLIHDFDLKKILDAGTTPASLSVLMELMQSAGGGKEDSSSRVFVLLASSFMELAGSMGEQSQEGSLYMTEERFKKVRVATESISVMENKVGGEIEVYNSILESGAKACDLPFDAEDPESRAVARLVCLTGITNAKDVRMIKDALNAMTKEDHAKVVRHLNCDGLEKRPSFAVIEATEFLQSAIKNSQIGLAQAMTILLRVYDEATKEFAGSSSPVVRIRFENLAAFAADFMGSAKFQDVPFKLRREHELEAVVIPKIWIPVSNESVLDKLRSDAFRFCQEIVKNKMVEANFKGSIARIYPELAYFGTNVPVLRDQTVCAMLCVYWLLTGQHEAFIRCQPQDQQLSLQSWAGIQDWLQKTVRLTSAEAIDAMLTFMAIHALGKFQAFREDFVKVYTADMHDLALAQILQEKPEVVPSFYRLSEKYQVLVLDCLRVDFQFSQFLQGENTAANLMMVKEKMNARGRDGHSFWLFRIFAQMCGKLGGKSLTGSLFMNEAQYKRCMPGLKALQQLSTQDGADAYNEFMLLRGSKAMSRFASPEHQALSRLLCLFDAYDKEEGSSLCAAFDELHQDQRVCLTQWLNRDGVHRLPGFTICGAAQMLKNAKENGAVGLVSALRMMLKVHVECHKHVSESSASRVVVHFDKVTQWAKEAGSESEGDFLQAQLTSWTESGEVQSDAAKVIFIDIIRPPPGAGPPPPPAEEIAKDIALAKSCPSCGNRYVADATFCRKCGQQRVHMQVTAGASAEPALPEARDWVRRPSAYSLNSGGLSIPELQSPSAEVPASTWLRKSSVQSEDPTSPRISLVPSPQPSPVQSPAKASELPTPSPLESGVSLGPPLRRRLPIGMYSLVGIALAILVFAMCLGDVELHISWRDLIVSLLIIASASLAAYMKCYDVEFPGNSGDGDEDLGPREPFLMSLAWGSVMGTSSREPHYSRLRTDDEVP